MTAAAVEEVISADELERLFTDKLCDFKVSDGDDDCPNLAIGVVVISCGCGKRRFAICDTHLRNLKELSTGRVRHTVCGTVVSWVLT